MLGNKKRTETSDVFQSHSVIQDDQISNQELEDLKILSVIKLSIDKNN